MATIWLVTRGRYRWNSRLRTITIGFCSGKLVGHYADDIVKFFTKGGDEVLEAASKSADEAFDASKATNKQKGNYGEIKSADNLVNNKTLKDAGYDLTKIGDDYPNGLDDTIKKGIDGIYENTGSKIPPRYVIDEAKYGTSKLSKLTDGTKQMSDDWVTGADRLADQVGPEKAREIMEAIDAGEVDKVLSGIDEAGNVTTKQLDSSGNILGNWP